MKVLCGIRLCFLGCRIDMVFVNVVSLFFGFFLFWLVFLWQLMLEKLLCIGWLLGWLYVLQSCCYSLFLGWLLILYLLYFVDQVMCMVVMCEMLSWESWLSSFYSVFEWFWLGFSLVVYRLQILGLEWNILDDFWIDCGEKYQFFFGGMLLVMLGWFCVLKGGYWLISVFIVYVGFILGVLGICQCGCLCWVYLLFVVLGMCRSWFVFYLFGLQLLWVWFVVMVWEMLMSCVGLLVLVIQYRW